MVFNSNINFVLFLSGFLFLWLLIVSLILIRTKRQFNRLLKGQKDKNLSEILEKVLGDIKNFKEKNGELKEKLEEIEKQGFSHLQKVGLLRFNPFEEVGSDQSFVLCLLDKNDNGLVLTSLTSRSGTRWYGKTVKNGEGVEHDLSKEEKETIKQAQGKVLK